MNNTIQRLKNRLKSLTQQYVDTANLKQFREKTDPARQAYLMAIRVRIDELKTTIKLIPT